MRGRTSGTTVPTGKGLSDLFRGKSPGGATPRISRGMGKALPGSVSPTTGSSLASTGLMRGLPLLMEGMAWAGMQGVGGLFNQTPFDIRTSNYEGQMMEKLTPEQRAQVYKNREGIEGLISGGNKEQSPYNAMISGIGRVAIVNAEHKSISAQANTYLADIAASIKKGSAMVVSGGGYSVPGSVGYLAAGEEGEYGVVGGKRKLIKATKGKKGALAGVEFGGGKVSVGGA
jgi:hypothetical protein